MWLLEVFDDNKEDIFGQIATESTNAEFLQMLLRYEITN